MATMRAVIFANGIMKTWPKAFEPCFEKDLVIAADGGFKHCRRWNLKPHIIVGDMDSVGVSDPSVLADETTQIQRFPTQKDETDLQLAIHAAMDRLADEIIILGALGARWDMTFSNVLILTTPLLAGVDARILDGPNEFLCLHGPQTTRLSGEVGHLISVIPLAGSVSGATLAGTRYGLHRETLPMGTTRGISNCFEESMVEIAIESGHLLVVVSREGHIP
jgi:thiamine pyrophosphokinase